jgi:hypothetical protein
MISGDSLFEKAQMANRPALTANQPLKTRSSRRRSIKSASAPAGSVNRKKGSVPAVDITESRSGDAPIEFMAQVAAMSWAVTQHPDITKANQTRK